MTGAALPPRKTYTVKDNFQYSYVYSKAQPSKPTFLLLHGFPCSLYDWRYQIAHLSAAGYGVIALDLLGYGETDKPTSIEEYAFSKISSHVVEVLNHEGLTEVIGVGHDWGSGLLSKFVNYFPKLFSSLVFMSSGYAPGAFELDSINQQTEVAFGYPAFGYMSFFNETDSAQIIENNLASFFSLLFPGTPDVWLTDMCPVGKAKEWIQAGKFSPLPSWETEQDREYRINLFKKGGMTGPLNWYKAEIRKVDATALAAIPPENVAITRPVLFIGGDKDYALRVEMLHQVASVGKQEGWLPAVEVKVIAGAGHWMLNEKPKEVFALLDQVAKNLVA